MDIKKINFYFKEALYSSFFLTMAFSITYPLFNYFNITEQILTYPHIVWGYIGSVLVAAVINYSLKNTLKNLLDKLL